MSPTSPYQSDDRQLLLSRRLHLIAAGAYLLWWVAVELGLPESFNPLGSRLAVVGYFAACWALSFTGDWARHHLASLFLAGAWILTLHFFYLFHYNQGGPNWILGTYITVMALNFCLFTQRSLFFYSLYVLSLGLGVTWLQPALAKTVFLPGLLTIVVQANIGSRGRLKALEKLSESNKQFQLLFHAAFEGMLVHENRIILNANAALAEMLNCPRERLLGRDMLEFIPPLDRPVASERIKAANATPYEMRALTEDMRVIEIEVRAKDFVYDKKPARLVTIQRIEDRRKAERDRIWAATMAENVRVRDEFISVASHELKTPLTSLKLRTQLMQRNLHKSGEPAPAPEKMREFLDLTARQIDRITELVEAMLDVSRIAVGRLSLNPAPTDLVELVREVVSLLRTQIENADYPLIIEAPESLIVSGDRARLSQVVENLLTNALKYGRGAPVRVALGITADGYASLAVADQGVGIAQENLRRIFDRFERIPSAQNIGGLGLGLYIAQQIAQAHGGRIEVESELGRGSCFTLLLPKAES